MTTDQLERAVPIAPLTAHVARSELSAAPGRASRLAIGGWVRHPLHLDASHLDAMEASAVDDFEVICTLDGSHGFLPSARTVPLRDLIELAKPAFEQRTDFKRMAIVAQGRDGYRALFSWAEVFNSPLGQGIVVAYDTAESHLPANAGPFALLARHDVATGPRYVRGLLSVELHKLW